MARTEQCVFVVQTCTWLARGVCHTVCVTQCVSVSIFPSEFVCRCNPQHRVAPFPHRLIQYMPRTRHHSGTPRFPCHKLPVLKRIKSPFFG